MSYQQCDSYFVESEESSYGRPDAREYAKMIKRRRQAIMATELSKQAVDDYLEDIVRHMRQMENDTLPSVASIDIQQEIQWFMRPYLLDFLIEAHAAFQLLPQTIFLAINLLDRYCSRRVVYKRHYQLVGCCCMLIAAKYGDKKERVPTIRELKGMCCSLYDDEMFTQMEWHILNTLDWIMGHPTVDSFLQVALIDQHPDSAVEHMAWYICEIALYHREFVSIKPSVMARTSIALARCILERQDFCELAFDHVENLTLIGLSHHLSQPSQVLVTKYSSRHMSCTSQALEQFLHKQAAITMHGAPPSPPCESALVQNKPLASNYNGYNTPSKSGQQACGYPSPPITPDGEFFEQQQQQQQEEEEESYPSRSQSQDQGGCPMTPSPLTA